jgi:hypothetical protein
MEIFKRELFLRKVPLFRFFGDQHLQYFYDKKQVLRDVQ